MSEIHEILNRLESGEALESDQLFPLVYNELRRMAAAKIAAERPGQTLDATSLVHESFLRLVGRRDQVSWQSKRHFFGAAAEAMRRILIESARRKETKKRGGGSVPIHVDASAMMATAGSQQFVALDEALSRLSETDPLKAELVNLRFFGGLTIDETAKMLDISTATATRYWNYARAWLQRELMPNDDELDS